MKTLAEAMKWEDENIPKQLPFFPFSSFNSPDMVSVVVGGCAIEGQGTDIDILIFAFDRVSVEQYWAERGFEVEGQEGEYPPDKFTSMRNGDINILVTNDDAFFNKWVRAVEVCRFIKETFGDCNRDARVKVHQLIMD